jgi:hypothetical protein
LTKKQNLISVFQEITPQGRVSSAQTLEELYSLFEYELVAESSFFQIEVKLFQNFGNANSRIRKIEKQNTNADEYWTTNSRM